LEATALRATDALTLLARDLAAELSGFPGADIEDKSLTLSVHFRRVPPSQHNDIRRIVETTIGKKPDRFSFRTGNHVCEVRPNVEWNKGTAVRWIKDRLEKPGTLVLYLGDDSTDEDAFLALREHITVKVGDPSFTSAHYHLEGPAEVKAFLAWLTQVRGNEARP
jgi:trehalose 6-phosphate phosphatase